MSLLDFYTAGTTEYVAVLFTTLFGSFGLLELAQRGEYRQFRSTLSWVYLLVATAAAWSVARIVGTEFLIMSEMQREGLMSQYQAQVSVWDPGAAIRLTGLFLGPQFYALYIGAPVVFFCIIFKVWLRLVYNMGFGQFLTWRGLRKVFREKPTSRT